MQVDLSKYNNSWYKPGAVFKRIIWHYVNIIFFKGGLLPFYGLKTFLLRAFGAKVGKGVLIKPFVNIKYPWFLELGDHTWIGEDVWIDNLAKVVVGKNVCISQGALLLSGNHDFSSSTFDLILKPIIIEDAVWIGAKSIVCAGVTCGTHAVLSINSVASNSLEPFGIYKGNPALKIKEREILS